MCYLSFITVWFQASQKAKYRVETLRLLACLKKIWSPDLKRFWMDNCLVNLSGKKAGFMPLDMLNEYIVREVKRMMHPHVTPETDAWLREVVSLLTMVFWDVRRRIAQETDSNIFDYHSSTVSPWKDSILVANKILRDGLCDARVNRLGGEKYIAADMFADGILALAKTDKIENLKKAMLGADGADWDESEDELENEDEANGDGEVEVDEEREENEEENEDDEIDKGLDDEEDRLSDGWVTD